MTNRERIFGRVLATVAAPSPVPVLTAKRVMQAIDGDLAEHATVEDRVAALATLTCRVCHKPLVWQEIAGGRHTAWCCDIFSYTNSYRD